MFLIVTGDLEISQRSLAEVLDQLTCNKKKVILLSGASLGVETQAENWAYERGHRVIQYPAEWARFGPHAQNIRNITMLDHAELNGEVGVVIFGEAVHMKRIAKLRKVALRCISS